MYNRYIPASARYEPVREPPRANAAGHPRKDAQRPPPPPPKGSSPSDGSSGGLSGLLKQFHLEHIDSGDILLVLILIFLFLEGDDNTELLITLGLLLVFGLVGRGGEADGQSSPSPTV